MRQASIAEQLADLSTPAPAAGVPLFNCAVQTAQAGNHGKNMAWFTQLSRADAEEALWDEAQLVGAEEDVEANADPCDRYLCQQDVLDYNPELQHLQ